MRRKRKRRVTKTISGRGLNLIETTVIIGIMALLLLGSFFGASAQIKKARDAKRKVDLEKISKAVNEYYVDYGCFPQGLPNCGENFQSNGKVYLPNFPCDPKNISYGYETNNVSCNTWFKLLANLEIASDKSIDKVGCRNGCGLSCSYNYGISSTNVAAYDGCQIIPIGAPGESLTPTDVVPTTPPKLYACAPPAPGKCIEYADPERSECPKVFVNDPTCNNECVKKETTCHDESGKKHGDDDDDD